MSDAPKPATRSASYAQSAGRASRALTEFEARRIVFASARAFFDSTDLDLREDDLAQLETAIGQYRSRPWNR